MKVLIVYASKYGSTIDVAAAIGETLRARGHAADMHEAGTAPAPNGYDAAVIGSAVYIGSWLKAASTYVDTHAAALRERPVWLYGVGPLGLEDPQPAGDPEQAATLVESVGARGYVTLSGALDRSRLSLVDRLITRVVKAPDGDFRDWEAIRAWTNGVAAALEQREPAADAQPSKAAAPFAAPAAASHAAPVRALMDEVVA